MAVKITNDFIPVQSPSPYHPDARRVHCKVERCRFEGIAIDDAGADHMMKCHARTHGFNVNFGGWHDHFIITPAPIGEPKGE